MGPIWVLLIEDNESDQVLTRRLMADARRASFHLVIAGSLAEGVARAAERTPDIILVDLHLEESQGIETLRQARALLPQVPLLVLTGLDDEQAALQALQEGAQDYLVKGCFEGDTLARVIRYAIERHQAQAALRRYQDRLEDLVEERSASLVRTNHMLEEEIRRHCQTETELLAANVRLSDALIALKRAQRCLIQSERLSALGQMAARMMHDFNNALMPIQGYTELLLEQPDLLEQRVETMKYLHEIRAATLRAAQEIRQLREFYQPARSGERQSVDLNLLLDTALARERERAGREPGNAVPSVSVVRNLGTVPAIPGNDAELQEAFASILANAYEAMPDGGKLTVTTRACDAGVEVTISDTGVGMAESTLQRCFEPFFSTKGAHAAGIGLAVVYGIVRAHGGQVDVRSHAGRGTTVVVVLPATLADVPRDASPLVPAARVPARALRILIIDDDGAICRLLGDHFRRRDHQVTSAICGQDGLRLFQPRAYDLVITDRAMPDISGDEVAARIRSQDPAVAILMLTGFGDLMKDAGTHPAGINGVVSKPVALEELDRAVAGVVG
ncbi:MAG: response regulator [Lentisphaerae bacterium]|nr:response regulator [Lentisphaerota bacterium]